MFILSSLALLYFSLLFLKKVIREGGEGKKCKRSRSEMVQDYDTRVSKAPFAFRFFFTFKKMLSCLLQGRKIFPRDLLKYLAEQNPFIFSRNLRLSLVRIRAPRPSQQQPLYRISTAQSPQCPIPLPFLRLPQSLLVRPPFPPCTRIRIIVALSTDRLGESARSRIPSCHREIEV